MENKLIESLLKVCQTLNAHSVEYLIVGGTAVALHGYYRLSHDPSGASMEKPDLDIWYNPTYDNYYGVLNTLEQLGLDVAEFREETSPNPKKSFFRFEQEAFKLDLLPEIPGLSRFRTSYNVGILTTFQEVAMRYLSYDDLIASKKAVSRQQDIEDIDQLNRRKNDPNNPQ